MHRTIASAVALAAVFATSARADAALSSDVALDRAIASPARTPKFVARDVARHPAQELRFFGLRPDETAVEIWPGAGYWTEILAPYLHDHGKLYAAVDVPGESAESDAATAKYRQKLAAAPALYDRVTLTTLGTHHNQVAPPGSADLVVTFRNLHNWMKAGYADAALAGFYQALKPGGVLGIEEHRARPDRPQDPAATSGYVRQDYAIALAEKAGFVFVAASEINANPKDITDWPKGVWTLPPSFALGNVDRAKYAAIGEADNFVLKFRKPGT